MSLESLDRSQQDSQPVTLYQFDRGTSTWRYIADDVPFVSDGETWSPESISMDSVVQSGEVAKDPLTIKLPITNFIAASYLGFAPDEVTALTVFSSQRAEPNSKEVIWTGRLLNAAASVAIVSLSCESIFASTRRQGLRQTYQRLCRRRFGGPGCFVNTQALATNVTVTGVAGSKVTLSSAPTTSFMGGHFKAPDSTLRYIIDQENNVLTLMRPIISLFQELIDHPSGFTSQLIPGCNRSTWACRSHNNLGNYGGWAGIPYVNPMDNSSQVF